LPAASLGKQRIENRLALKNAFMRLTRIDRIYRPFTQLPLFEMINAIRLRPILHTPRMAASNSGPSRAGMAQVTLLQKWSSGRAGILEPADSPPQTAKDLLRKLIFVAASILAIYPATPRNPSASSPPGSARSDPGLVQRQIGSGGHRDRGGQIGGDLGRRAPKSERATWRHPPGARLPFGTFPTRPADPSRLDSHRPIDQIAKCRPARLNCSSAAGSRGRIGRTGKPAELHIKRFRCACEAAGICRIWSRADGWALAALTAGLAIRRRTGPRWGGLAFGQDGKILADVEIVLAHQFGFEPRVGDGASRDQ